MKTEHAPLPFRQLDEIILSTHDGQTDWVAGTAERKETAAFIVRACNAHDDLVAALDRMAEFLAGVLKKDGFPHDTAMLALALIDRADAAIAKAKGE